MGQSTSQAIGSPVMRNNPLKLMRRRAGVHCVDDEKRWLAAEPSRVGCAHRCLAKDLALRQGGY